MTALPVELIERIIDYAAEDFSTLKECSLIHSVFLPRCRVHQFRTVVLHGPSTYFRFEKLIKTAPYIAGLTTDLTLMDIGKDDDADRLLPIGSILDHLQNICSLTLKSKYPYGIRWKGVPYSSKVALYAAFSRPTLTCVTLDLCLPGSQSDAESIVRLWASKLRHLRLHCALRELSRDSFDSESARLESLALYDPRIAPTNLVPGTSALRPPLLDLGGLTSFDLDLDAPMSSYEWIKTISQCCSHSLHTFVWRPTHIDLDGMHVQLYSLSQLPVLRHLRINTKKRRRPERIASFLRRLLSSLSSTQILKSLKVQFEYEYGLKGYYETFVEHMKDFMRGLSNVEHIVIAISCPGLDQKRFQAAIEALQGSGLEGVYPGTSCELEFELQ